MMRFLENGDMVMTKMAVRAIHGQNFEKKIQTRNPIILQLHIGMGHWGLMVCKVSINGDNALTFTYVTARSRWLNGRASRLGAGGRGLESRPRHTKEYKNGISGYHARCSDLYG